MDLPWRIELLGGLRVKFADRTVITRFETRKTGALLAYLAYDPQHARSREVLAELLWPEEDPDATRARLRQALAALRRALERDDATETPLLVAYRAEVRVDGSVLNTDVAEFRAGLRRAAGAEQPAERAEILARTVPLYAGELLPGFYEDWILSERESLTEEYICALHQLSGTLSDLGDVTGAVEHARKAVFADPLREDSHCRLMREYKLARRLPEALRQYHELERLLHEKLATTPSQAARELFAQLAQAPLVRAKGAAAIESSTPAPDRASSAAPTVPGLPAQPLPAAVQPPRNASPEREKLEPVGGAVPLASGLYITRVADDRFRAAIARRDSVILLKGPRQVGKTSLLARGLQQARQTRVHVVRSDLQKLNARQLQSPETVFQALAESIADQLELEAVPGTEWQPHRGPSENFERFWRRLVFRSTSGPIIWGLDEADRLFACPFCSEIFGLFRSWHNERALDPEGPWSRLTLAIAYATEAHLFITDPHQSPFNVGTRLALEDFGLEQVAELNRRYGSPLRGATELASFYSLLGGNPYLVRRALFEMVDENLDLSALLARLAPEEGIFYDQFQRIRSLLAQSAELLEAVRALIAGAEAPTAEAFYRLRSAGIVAGESRSAARPRCGLYRTFLERLIS